MTKHKPATKSVIIDPTYSPVMKRWRDMTDHERHREMIRYAASKGGRAVSLNFSERFEKFIQTAKDPIRQVGKRMNRELLSHDLRNLPILLVLEASANDKRPHVHGVYIEQEVNPVLVREAMCRAVGKVGGRSGSRQFFHQDIFCAAGWFNYITMHDRLTRRLLSLDSDTRLCWASRSLRRGAVDFQTATRAQSMANYNHQLPDRAS